MKENKDVSNKGSATDTIEHKKKETEDERRPEQMSLKEFMKVNSTLSKKILEIVNICLHRDYMAARNAIVMLQKLETVYPVNKDMIEKLKGMMDELILT